MRIIRQGNEVCEESRKQEQRPFRVAARGCVFNFLDLPAAEDGKKHGSKDPPLQRVLEGVSDRILDDDLIPAVVRDGVVEQLRRSWIQFLVVFIGDISGYLLEHLVGLGAQIRAGDLDLFAHVWRGDSLGEFAGGLVVIFRDLAMAVLMFDHIWVPTGVTQMLMLSCSVTLIRVMVT